MPERKTLFIDIESHSADLLWSMKPREFVRTLQYGWGREGEIRITEDYDEMLSLLRSADLVIGHNIHAFDLTALFGKDSTEPLQMSLDHKVLDTFTWASVVMPSPTVWTDKNGHTHYDGNKPEKAMKWLALDNLAHQLGLPGKMGDLKDIAKRYNPPKTLIRDLDFGLIPTSDSEFREYAIQDIVALRALALHLLALPGGVTPYIWREQEFAAICAQNSRNGWTVDIQRAEARVAELAEKRAVLMDEVTRKYGLPSEGKMPWRTNAGKAVIFKALAEFGITPDTVEWPRTKTGNPSLGGDELIQLTVGTPAQDLGEALAALMGQRSLAQLALDSTFEDGKVHPSITSLQRSGRACLPETHRILTRRGILSWSDIRVGDETIDMRGNWVKVTNVLHFDDAPVHRYENRSVLLESTPEHRWVQHNESGSALTRCVAPIEPGSRAILQLTPDSYPFDPEQRSFPRYMTERERFAALVGFLVTDGSASDRSDSPNSFRFSVCQTENKFYDVFKGVIDPDLITGDYSRPVWGNPNNTLHEIRLDSGAMRTLLIGEGLDATGGLRHSDTLLPWVLSLTPSENLAFLTAAYLSDGNVSNGSVAMSSKNRDAVPVFQIAAYRAGRRSNYRIYTNKRDSYWQGILHLTRDRVSARHFPEPVVYNAPVWCVETETGTFTAWGPDGDFSGPYLTGNSTTKPGLTVWSSREKEKAVDKAYFIASPGCKLFEVDFSAADARIVAAYSGDSAYLERLAPGVDAHELTGRLVFGDEEYEAAMPEGWETDPKLKKDNPLRIASKMLTHAYSYGARANTLFKNAKKEGATEITLELCQKFVDAMDSAYGVVVKWQKESAERGRTGWITNDWGRRMRVDPERAFTQSSALLGQSGTRELLVDGLIRMAHDNIEYITWIKAQIHDAVVFDVPIGREQEARDMVERNLHTKWKPQHGGQEVDFPVSSGEFADNWFAASHG